MMKGAAEKAVQTQTMPGQSGARQAPRARMGADQLMADFEGLLARHSAVRDLPLDKLDNAAADNRLEQSPRATPETLFMALSGNAELVTQDQPQREGDSGDGDEPAKADDAQPQSAAPPPQNLALLVEVEALRPRMPVEVREERPISKDEAPSPKPSMGAAEASPSMNEKRGDDSVVDLAPAVVDDASDSPAVADKRSPRIVEEAPVADKAARSQDGVPPVTLIRVAGQETHFAPVLAPMLGDQKIDSLHLSTPAEPDEPVRSQPALLPVAVKPPNGPLKTLKVELGSHELGLVNATVAIKDKVLDLRIGAARDDAVASLKENAGKLSDALQALGYSVDGVSVQKMQQSDTGAQTGTGQPAQQDAGGQDARGQGQQRTSSGSGFGSENSHGQSRHARHDDHLAEQQSNDQAKGTADSRNSRGVFL